MILKIKVKKIIWTKLYFRQFYITRKFELQVSFVDKGSGSGIFPDPDPVFFLIRIRVTQKDRIRPDSDPDPQHCLTEHF